MRPAKCSCCVEESKRIIDYSRSIGLLPHTFVYAICTKLTDVKLSKIGMELNHLPTLNSRI